MWTTIKQEHKEYQEKKRQSQIRRTWIVSIIVLALILLMVAIGEPWAAVVPLAGGLWALRDRDMFV